MALVIVRLGPNIVPEIIAEMNYARLNPREYALIILGLQYKNLFNASDIAEAVRYLLSITPCTNTLLSNPYLERMAQEWVDLQGPVGGMSHGDFSTRMNRGTYRAIAENLQYGFNTARDVVVSWVVDQGVPNRGHRLTIFNCIYNLVGIGFGQHTRYRYMTSAIFAQDFKPFMQSFPTNV